MSTAVQKKKKNKNMSSSKNAEGLAYPITFVMKYYNQFGKH